jgi:hypothetical protein
LARVKDAKIASLLIVFKVLRDKNHLKFIQ